MLQSLVITALLMGLGGLAHCGTMCAAPCAAVLPRGVPVQALIGRTLGYAGLGALAAGAMGALSAWSRWATALQPLWVMLLAATALLGAWTAFKGAVPPALQDHGVRGYQRLHNWVDASPWLTRHPGIKSLLPMALGLAWAALPCGLLYGAVTVATLAGSVGGGALVMAVFSLPGALALWWLPRRLAAWTKPQGAMPRATDLSEAAIAPILWQPRLQGGTPSGSPVPRNGLPPNGRPRPVPGLGGPWARWPWLADPRWAVRLSGAVLCAAAGSALAQRLQAQWLAWCA